MFPGLVEKVCFRIDFASQFLNVSSDSTIIEKNLRNKSACIVRHRTLSQVQVWLIRDLQGKACNMAANANSSADNIVAGAMSRGIPVEILDREVNSNFLCTVCKLLPRNPVQSFCGHRFCDDCVRDQLSRLTHVILCINLWFKILIITYFRFCHIINSIYKLKQYPV